MTVISVLARSGAFAEDKDVARDLRMSSLEPALKAGEVVTLDFTGVSLATQSFLHALLSATIRSFGPGILDRLRFKGCSPAIKSLISLVCEYTQERDEDRVKRTPRRPSGV